MASQRAFIHVPENCWRAVPAERLAFLIDGEAYFRALREAMCQARHSILILGWDIDTRLRLVRDERPDDLPESLGEFLYALLNRSPGLHVRVLNWDWAVLYATERQWLPLFKLQWHRHPRFHYHPDDDCPFGASQHQKVVVIDGELAFCGGFDLSRDRWDTPDHAPGDGRRVNPEGDAYPPFHDVQVMVSGEAARALDELARERWARATGETVRPADEAGRPWPESVQAELAGPTVGIARTYAPHRDQPGVREVEQLYLDAIAAARHTIYIENQYLSSTTVADALAARLEDPDGPEVVLVLPLKTGGWLEQHTMDVLRSRLLRRLHEADGDDRLRVLYPHHADLGESHISLHSKLMTVDDRFLRVGSANLSNRSMGLDSECDLALEATGPDERAAVAGLRNRLLAEHLGTTPGEVTRRIHDHGSVIRAVEELRGGRRSLEYLEAAVPDLADELLPDHDIVDPEKPITPEALATRLIPEEERPGLVRQLTPVATVLLVLLGLAAAWRWTPLGAYLEVDNLVAAVHGAGGTAGGGLALLAAFVVGGVVAVPVTLLAVVTVLVAGPWQGFLIALTGSVASALVSFWLGAAVGRRPLERIAGSRLNRLSRRLARRGIVAVITLRIVPVAPFTVVNMAAGASHISFRDFALGTLVGMFPGLGAIALFTDRVAATVHKPQLPEFAVLAAVVAAIAVAAWGLRHWLLRRRRAGASAD